MKIPDAEAMVIEFLASRVAPARVVSKVPANRPLSFVRVWRTGGAAVNRVLDQPLVTVQAWGNDAWDLAGACRESLLNESSQMRLVRGVTEITGPYFDPDPGTNIDRVTFTVQLQVRAAH